MLHAAFQPHNFVRISLNNLHRLTKRLGFASLADANLPQLYGGGLIGVRSERSQGL